MNRSWTSSGPVRTGIGPGPVPDWDRTAVLPKTAGTGPSVRSSAGGCGPVRSRSSVLPQRGQKTGQDRTLQHYQWRTVLEKVCSNSITSGGHILTSSSVARRPQCCSSECDTPSASPSACPADIHDDPQTFDGCQRWPAASSQGNRHHVNGDPDRHTWRDVCVILASGCTL